MRVFRDFYEDESGITVIEIVLVLVENLALYIACLEGEKSLKNKLYVRHTQ